MFHSATRLFCAVTLVPTVFLTACSESNTSPNTNVYRTLLSDDAATSQVIAQMRVFETGGSVAPNIVTIGNGTINHGTKAFEITLPFGQSALIADGDGPDNLGVLVDDTNPSITGTNIRQEVGNAYGYVQPLLINDPTGTNNIRYYGYAGIPTAPEDMPSSGTAVFNGTIGGNAPFEDWEQEPATLTATFAGTGNGTVDLSAQNVALSGDVVALSITDATISGTRFFGGTAVATLNGAPIDISSQVTPAFAGNFFGYNAPDGVPGDVGAVFGAKGAISTFDLTLLGSTISPNIPSGN